MLSMSQLVSDELHRAGQRQTGVGGWGESGLSGLVIVQEDMIKKNYHI